MAKRDFDVIITPRMPHDKNQHGPFLTISYDALANSLMRDVAQLFPEDVPAILAMFERKSNHVYSSVSARKEWRERVKESKRNLCKVRNH